MSDNFFNLNHPDFYGTLYRFVINVVFLIILIRYIYFRYTKKEKFAFTFFLMGIMVFFLTSMLNTNVLMQFSFGFGLFAIFAILRFRTRNFSLKDMSYIFTVIGLSLINAIKVIGFPVLGVIIFNIIVLIAVVILEKFSLNHRTTTHSIIYENLELLRSGKKQKLIRDVSELTGKDILRVKIRRINFKEKFAVLDIYYRD
jgi:signal transduction histidine kinase